MMAAADRVTIEIAGRGGHGAHPYQTVDRFLVAGHIHHGGTSIVSRNVRAIDSAVISLCAMQAGDLSAMERGAGRSNPGWHGAYLQCGGTGSGERRLVELCKAVAHGFGAQAMVKCRTHVSSRPSIPSARPGLPRMWPRPWWALIA